jgi:hypothetical protein
LARSRKKVEVKLPVILKEYSVSAMLINNIPELQSKQFEKMIE